MKIKDVIALCTGTAAIVGSVSLLAGFLVGSPDENWRVLKTQCEKELTENQKCVMTYVVAAKSK